MKADPTYLDPTSPPVRLSGVTTRDDGTREISLIEVVKRQKASGKFEQYKRVRTEA